MPALLPEAAIAARSTRRGEGSGRLCEVVVGLAKSVWCPWRRTMRVAGVATWCQLPLVHVWSVCQVLVSCFVGGLGFAWVTHWLLACQREAACARTFQVSAAVDRGRQSRCCSYLEAVTLYAAISIGQLVVGCTTLTYAQTLWFLCKGDLPSWRFPPGCRIANI